MERGLGGVAFERFIARQLGLLGWSVAETATTGDFGADLLAKSGSERAVVQCKDYGKRVGIEPVQEIFLARAYYSANLAIVVARNGFTKAARRGAQSAGVILMRPEELASGCRVDRSVEQRRREEDAARARAAALRRETEERQQRAEALRKEAAARADAEALWRGARELRQRALAEAARKKKGVRISQSWRQYDVDAERFERFRAASEAAAALILRSALVLIVATLLLPREMALVSGSFASALAGVFVVLRCLRTHAPERPFASRRGAVISCNACSTRLCVDYGKEGAVRCPRCGAITDAKT